MTAAAGLRRAASTAIVTSGDTSTTSIPAAALPSRSVGSSAPVALQFQPTTPTATSDAIMPLITSSSAPQKKVTAQSILASSQDRIAQILASAKLMISTAGTTASSSSTPASTLVRSASTTTSTGHRIGDIAIGSGSSSARDGETAAGVERSTAVASSLSARQAGRQIVSASSAIATGSERFHHYGTPSGTTPNTLTSSTSMGPLLSRLDDGSMRSMLKRESAAAVSTPSAYTSGLVSSASSRALTTSQQQQSLLPALGLVGTSIEPSTRKDREGLVFSGGGGVRKRDDMESGKTTTTLLPVGAGSSSSSTPRDSRSVALPLAPVLHGASASLARAAAAYGAPVLRRKQAKRGVSSAPRGSSTARSST